MVEEYFSDRERGRAYLEDLVARLQGITAEVGELEVLLPEGDYGLAALHHIAMAELRSATDILNSRLGISLEQLARRRGDARQMQEAQDRDNQPDIAYWALRGPDGKYWVSGGRPAGRPCDGSRFDSYAAARDQWRQLPERYRYSIAPIDRAEERQSADNQGEWVVYHTKRHAYKQQRGSIGYTPKPEQAKRFDSAEEAELYRKAQREPAHLRVLQLLNPNKDQG